MSKTEIHEFSGVPGVKGGKLKGPMAKSVSGFMLALRKYRACSDAGDYGGVMVWRDDDGAYRCHFMRFQASLEQQLFKTKAQVRAWLVEWLPRQSHGDGIA